MGREEIFGKILVKLRLERNLTQEKLAEMASINEKHIQKIEHGYSPSLRTIIKLCDALDISLHHFMFYIDIEYEKEKN